MSKLKTLYQFNKERAEHYQNKKLDGNGIICPKCGNEMMDNGNNILMSNPPQRQIICMTCNHQNYRIA